MTEREQAYYNLDAMLSRHCLGNYPEKQAEAIAHHYLSMTLTAQFLMGLVQQQRYSENHLGLQDVIDDTVAKFKTTHLRDLGLSLEWKKTLPL